MSTSLVIDDLRSIISKSRDTKYIETRYLSRITNEVNFSNGELETIRTVHISGCGIRVLVDGCWGFSSTNNVSRDALIDSTAKAVSAARVLAETKKNKVTGLAQYEVIRGVFKTRVNTDLDSVDIEKKIKVVQDSELHARKYSESIKSASCVYHEILDHKIIVNSDGTEVEIYDSKPEFNVVSVARMGTESVTISEGVGITGGWNDLFQKKDPTEYATLASEKATKLLGAKHVRGEKTALVLDPGMVGLISHEAIGHMVEADFVLSGSIVKDKIGHKIASDMITLVDSGQSNIAANAAGTIPVDDEGVVAGRTAIIEKDIIKQTRHGYLIKGPRNGQADANGEFMFGSQEVYRIEKGEIQESMKAASISGNAFDVLQSVDMVGNDFEYDIGTGYCGKFQPAKVDGGGPHIRCKAIVGGLQ